MVYNEGINTCHQWQIKREKRWKRTQTGPGIELTSLLFKFSQLISLAKANHFHNPISNHLLSSSSCLIICIRPISKHTARQGQLGSTYPSRPSYLEIGKNYFKKINNMNRFQQVRTTDEILHLCKPITDCSLRQLLLCHTKLQDY